jgi:hypothetical protein
MLVKYSLISGIYKANEEPSHPGGCVGELTAISLEIR